MERWCSDQTMGSIVSKKQKVAARFYEPDGSITNKNLIKIVQSNKQSINYTIIIDGNQIEALLLKYGHSWFQQVSTTPTGHGEFFDTFGYNGLTNEADALLQGKYLDQTSMSMSSELEGSFKQRQCLDVIEDINTVISYKGFVSGFGK